jgi:predicted nucleic acid-binding protein
MSALLVPALRTFPDAGVLIAGARGTGANRERALRIFADPDRVFLASSFLYLEVVPKAAFNKKIMEASFYDQFFRQAEWMKDLDKIVALAQEEGTRFGLGAMDALHLAAAHLVNAHEFITTERLTSPLYRSRLVKVVCLYE